MSSIFENVRTYEGKWNLKSETRLDDEDKALFSSAKVIPSDYGKSVCFCLVSGGYQYIPMSSQGKQLTEGERVDLDKVTIQTLHREGSKDIYRVKIDD